MRVFLDDKRPMPADFNIHVKTAQEAIALLKTGNVIHISLDHDLGPLDECGSGYQVATYIEAHAYAGDLPWLTWATHSQNPVGVSNMQQALKNADRYWERNP